MNLYNNENISYKSEMSYAQKSLYLTYSLDKENPIYNEPWVYKIEGKLDFEALSLSINEIVRRHDCLRTTFQHDEKVFFQIIWKSLPIEITKIKLHKDIGQDELKTILKIDARICFDLTQAPLLKVSLYEIDSELHYVLFNFHHIIVDGWSLGIFMQELKTFMCEFESENFEHKLPSLKNQYYDYTLYHNDLIKNSSIDSFNFWKDKIQINKETFSIPYDKISSQKQSNNGKRVYISLPGTNVKELKALSLKNRSSLFIILLAIYKILLFKISNQTCIKVGVPFANRNNEKFSGIIGLFINSLPIINNLNQEMTFQNLIYNVRASVFEAIENQDYPFGLLVDKLRLRKDTNNPLFRTMFVLQNAPLIFEMDTTNTKFSYFELDINTSKIDLLLELYENKESLFGWFEYNPDLYFEGTILQMKKYLLHVVSQVIKNPGIKIRDINLTDPTERESILTEFNNTDFSYEENSIINTIEHNFSNYANKIYYKNSEYSFNEFQEKTNFLCHKIENMLGSYCDPIVGIHVDRSPEMIIAIYATLKAGAAYLPIDPNYPKKRVSYLINDSGCKLLLTNDVSILGNEIDCEIIDLLNLNIDHLIEYNTQRDISPNSLAYVIYTSGSTGNPKGVMIEHKALSNRIRWMQRKYPIDENDVILFKTPFTFDVSVWELFWWAKAGAGICILEPGGEKEPSKIVDAIEKHNVTIVHFVPSMLKVFLDYIRETNSVKRIKSLNRVFSSGEELNLKQVKSFNELLYKTNGTHLTNLYGPTEATVDVSFFDCTPCDGLEKIPIGKPIDNIKLFIVDEGLNMQPVGVPGELCISGLGLARGYLCRPKLTSEKFVANPFIEGDRIYKTGDIAKWLPDGNIEYLGRKDDQVKIRGFRIELGEIEAAIKSYTSINDAVALVKELAENEKRLIAFIQSKSTFSPLQLRKFLRDRLPEYMIPSHFEQIDEIPLSANGKANKKSLMDIKMEITGIQKQFVPPKSKMEIEVAKILEENLRISQVGLNDNFLDMGGHSLLLINIITQLKQKYKVEPDYRDLIEQTIGEFVCNYQNKIKTFLN